MAYTGRARWCDVGTLSPRPSASAVAVRVTSDPPGTAVVSVAADVCVPLWPALLSELTMPVEIELTTDDSHDVSDAPVKALDHTDVPEMGTTVVNVDNDPDTVVRPVSVDRLMPAEDALALREER